MKKLLLTTILIFALATSLMAQSRRGRVSRAMRDATEMIILDEMVDDNYTVKRYLVKQKSGESDEFSMHYRINLSKLNSSYDNNDEQIKALNSLINTVKEDTLKKITRFSVVGYTSPDGPAALNQKLSVKRATACESYLDNECGMMSYPRSVKGVCSTWADAKPSIEGAPVPNKTLVLREINEGGAQMVIENDLKGLPNAWRYMCVNTLPPMRCVDVELCYNQWEVVEEREVVEKPAPRTVIIDLGRVPRRDLLDDGSTALLFAMPDQPLDYPGCKDRRRDDERIKYKYTRRGAKLKEYERDGRQRGEAEFKEHYRNARHMRR